MQDQFLAGLYDDGLRRDLRMKVTLDNTLTFLDVKKEAILRADWRKMAKPVVGW